MIPARINTAIPMNRHRTVCWNGLRTALDQQEKCGIGLRNRERQSLLFLSYQTRCSSIGVEYDDQNFRWRQSQSGTGCIREKDFLRTDKRRRIPSTDIRRPLLFLQSLFHRNPPKSPVQNLRIQLRKPKGNPAVFLLSLRRIHQLPDDRRAVAVF